MLAIAGCVTRRQTNLGGFEISPYFGEQVRQLARDDVRIAINAPAPPQFGPTRPTLLIFYALPNGNTIEQTIGSKLSPGVDWHFDIQHIGAQTRALRAIDRDENIVVVYLEPAGRSWSNWRKRPDNTTIIRDIVASISQQITGNPTRVVLAAHSGGGNFIFGYIDGGDAIPDDIERIAFLDANYGYDDNELHHGDKFIAWLRAEHRHRLIVMAYDDRKIELNGKRVVSETGGTYRATHRMLDRFEKELKFTGSQLAGFDAYDALDAHVRLLVHPNPENKILHTTMVGEWNGFLEAITFGTPRANKWGKFGAPRAYANWVQPATEPAPQPASAPARAFGIPARPTNAVGGHEFMRTIATLPPSERETAIVRELSRGNVPPFLRTFKTIRVHGTGIEGIEHSAEYQVMPDYLAVGSDEDWVRVPMTPMAAQAIADRFGCTLPTRKIADDVYAQADVKLEPRPLTERREADETFVQHHEIIESQRAGNPLGALVAGIKKDVVITNRLKEKPDHVAIYGWHKLDGQPIQPLTIVHKQTYVDYSHGIRLVNRTMLVDGQKMSINDVLQDPQRCALVSDEGPVDPRQYAALVLDGTEKAAPF